MTHLEEAQLLAVRDGEAGAEAHAGHLAACTDCLAAVEQARGRQARLSGALGALGGAEIPWDAEGARARVRARVAGLTAERSGTVPLRPRRPWAVMTLGRAAGLLLVTAAGLSALPGSPVRTWFSSALAPFGAASPEATAPLAAPAPEPLGETTGVRLAVPSGPVSVVLTGTRTGDSILVRWVPGAEAAVMAPVGSRFTTAEGRLAAAVVPGGIRVELPRGVTPLSLEVDGRVYLRSTGSALEVPGPVERRTPDEILFLIR